MRNGMPLTWSFKLRLVKAGTFFANFTFMKRSRAADSHSVSEVSDGRGDGSVRPRGKCKREREQPN